MKEYYGYYNEWGYRIFDINGDEIYNAGNSPHESSGVVARADGLPLTTLREFCNYTGKMIAKDNDGKWFGCKRYRG